MALALGCIADDFTGATDLANTLTRGGLRTVQVNGVPRADLALAEADAVVVALKSRTAPVKDAVEQSLAALAWLRERGAARFLFKVCSTFDSTDAGNIGPVADALLGELGDDLALVCPAFPANGRTVYQGHLFVGTQLLSDSPMRDHPLTPMRDANLVRVLGRQTRHKVGLLPHAFVRLGAEAVHAALHRLRSDSVRYAIADATDDEDLHVLAQAARDLPLLVGGSGIALGLPENARALGTAPARDRAEADVPRGGPALVLAGSCSQATRGQVDWFARSHPARRLDVAALLGGTARTRVGECSGCGRRSRTERVRRSSIRVLLPPRCSPCRTHSGRRAAAALPTRSSPPLPTSRGRRWPPGCAASSSPAAKLRVPSCRHSASKPSRSARKSIPACRGRPCAAARRWRWP